MASRGSGSNGHHLDATGDRDVVYCHACRNEWYRDEHGLICPRCDDDAIEIVEPGNDPREIDHHDADDASTPPEFRNRHYMDDSDPEEADIEDHLGADSGFAFNNPSMGHPPDHGHRDPSVDPVIERFIDMVQGLGPAQGFGGRGGTPGYDPVRDNTYNRHGDMGQREHHGDGDGDGDDTNPHRPFPPRGRSPQTLNQNFPDGARIQRTTFRAGPFGATTSVTIFAPPGRTPRAENQIVDGGPDPFDAIISSILRDVGSPGVEGTQPGIGGTPQAFARGLQGLLGFLNPANAVSGDVVYSQEALDRIISNLMEANPQSNAAPPATEDAIRNLERRPVDAAMLGTDSKTECSICIDEMNIGDKAVFLPCKHWFHEDCVVLWLKEHNTCPICRTPIEKNERENNANTANAANAAAGAAGTSSSAGTPQTETPPRTTPGIPRVTLFGRFPPNAPSTDSQTPPAAGPNRWFAGGNNTYPYDLYANPPSGDTRPRPGFAGGQSARPPSQRHSRLNEALRSVSSMQERQREREREQATSTGVSYDTSRLQRRNSLSPTSPRTAMPGDQGSRMRERSPSQSGGRWAASDREAEASDRQANSQRQSGSSGPLSWLRDRLSGSGSNSNNPPPRDDGGR